MNTDYITAAQLSTAIGYDERTIRTQLKDSVLIEGIHYIRPFGRRRLLFHWPRIQRDMVKFSKARQPIKDVAAEVEC